MKAQVMKMTELLDRIRDIKKTKCFRYAVTIIIMIVFAAAINSYRQNTVKREDREQISVSESQNEDNSPDDENFIIRTVKENKAHLIALSCVSAGLVYVKYKQKHRIKESR